jgi:PAS domain S-box-containing protein
MTVNTASDLDAAARTAAALDQVGDSLISAFDHVSDVFVFIKNARREFIGCSLPFVTLMGFKSRAQLIGKRDEELSPAYLVQRYRRDDEHVLTTGEALVDVIELVRNADGGYDWFLSTKTPVRDAAGTVTGLVGVTRSLTSRDPVNEKLISLTPAIETISREYARPIKVEELAASVLMSPSHFTRLFRRHFGVSPYRYLRRVRIMAACDLLATTELPVGVVSARTGFYDPSHFANEFHADRGMSPTAYRESFQRDQRHPPSELAEIWPVVPLSSGP